MPDPTTPEEAYADALLREVISHFDYDSWKELEEEGWNHLVGERRAIQAALLRAEARVLMEVRDKAKELDRLSRDPNYGNSLPTLEDWSDVVRWLDKDFEVS